MEKTLTANGAGRLKTNPAFQPVVNDLIRLIVENNWADRFESAITNAHRQHIPQLADIKNLDNYLTWINSLLTWIPSENYEGREVYNQICKFYFILDQPPVRELQNRVIPQEKAQPLTALSQWMLNFARAMGQFLDTPDSLSEETLRSFYNSPKYNMHEYIRPHGGWKTFNQFFARNYKPGYRPVAAIGDHRVLVSPADSTFAGQWEIRKDSQVTVKNLHWRIEELLEGSPYKHRFTNGIFTHSFLNTTDYHRLHTPVAGKVLEARVIPGQVYLNVKAVPVAGSEGTSFALTPVRQFDALDDVGYQFAQARGLFVIESPIGLVAVLPMGMAQVSSVVATAEEGVTLRKGEEIAYFQFGGSDIVVLYEAACNVHITAQPNTHYKIGSKIGEAYPLV